MNLRKHLLGVIPCALLASGASAQFVINEIESDTQNVPSTDYAEFVELKGPANTSVEDLVLVFYNGFGTAGGTPRAYLALDLTGTSDGNGFYVAGNTGVNGVVVNFNTNTLQNGEDGVALYSGVNASDFVATNNASAHAPSAPPAGAVLVDYIMYETGNDATPNWTPFTGSAIDEGGAGASADHTIGRDPDGSGSFVLGFPTPGAPNTPLPLKVASVPTSVNFGRTNEAVVSTRTVTLRNTGIGSMQVTSFGLDAGASDAEITQIAGPVPAVPVTLGPDEATTIVIQFSNADLSASEVFTGEIDFVTDAPTSGSGSIPVTAEFVKVEETGSVGDVVVNEFSYDPNADSNGGIQDYNNDGILNSTQDEFIEIYNTTAAPINIQGWELNAQNGPGGSFSIFPYIFPLGTTLPANGVLVVFNAGTPTGFAPGTALTDGPALSNNGATIEVTNGTTRIDGVAYLDAEGTAGFTDVELTANGGSIGRRPDGSSQFIEFVHNATNPQLLPTPGLSNGSLTPAHDWQLFE